MTTRTWRLGATLGIILAVTALIAGLLWPAPSGEKEASADDSPTPSAPADEGEAPTQEEDERECPSSWVIMPSDKENNRWFAGGLRSIREASTPEEAREAAETWLDLVRRDPQLLAGAAAYFLDDREVDPSTLVEEDGKCASEAAVLLVALIELALADSEITPEDAPSDGRNSGTNGDGDVVASENPGISGDRSSVKIEMKDGTTIWILGRCGNPVVKGPAPVPPGPTDEPEPEKEEPPATTAPPTTAPPTTVAPKDSAEEPSQKGDVPTQVQGEAPTVTEPASGPAAGQPPVTYETPPPPPPAPPTTQPGPPVTAPPTTAPQPTVPDGPDNPNVGTNPGRPD